MQKQILKYKSPIGTIRCIFEGPFLVDVEIGGRYTPSKNNKAEPMHHRLMRELEAYFKGIPWEFRQTILFVKGTPFEHRVWLTLKEIPYGQVRTYKWVAEQVGSPNASRAVGQALKKNPLPIILPCHRVIASDGSIGGYSCGVKIKEWLLQNEKNSVRLRQSADS